jgi:hypothetical protein
MKQSSLLFNLLGTVGFVGLLSGCGSGGGGGTTTTPSTGGTTSGTAAASGTITSLSGASTSAGGSVAAAATIPGSDSVFVNGTGFDTNGSGFIVDGKSGSKKDLKRGMTVTVTGSIKGDQRSAIMVLQKDAVEGLVESIEPDYSRMVVMGQTVFIDGNTQIDDKLPDGSRAPNSLKGDIRNLLPNEYVEVNGHTRPNGEIQATFVERKDQAAVTPEVRGFVTGHVPGATTFQIGTLTVNYTGADITTMPDPTGILWDGLFVEIVEAHFSSFDSVGRILTATRVGQDNLIPGNIVDDFAVEGFVTETQVEGTADFMIGTTRVRTASTEFLGGTIGDIALGVKLSAQGRLANGVLTAAQVRFSARAVTTIGFDGMSPGLFGGIEAGFIILANGNNDWSVVGDAGNNFISSTLNGSSFYVESSVLDGEFTVQGFDVSSIGGASTFFIVGLADRDDQNAELFRFSYSVPAGAGFERISLADELRRLTSSFNPLANNDTTDDARTSFNVNLDKVQRVIISVSHGEGVTSSVDSVHVGTGGQ